MLNRLLVIETGKRLKDHSPKLASQVLLAPLEAGLKDILNRAGPLVFGQLQHSDRAPPVHRVPWGLGAERMFGELVEEVHRLCDTAMAGAGASHLIGPAQFISRPTVINFLVRAPLSVCAMDEFGSFLKRINSRKASGFEGAISGVLRTTWGSSFKPMPTPELAPKGAGKDHALQQLLGDVMAQAFFAPRRDGRSDRYDLAIGCDPRDADRVIGSCAAA